MQSYIVMDRLRERFLASRLILPEEFYQKADQFARMLLSWNKIHNLSGAKEMHEVERHIFDSIFPLSFLEDFKTALDIGSGAGFPALPLAMAKSRASFTLVEPLAKRSSFLQFAAMTLQLENVTVIDKRIEQAPIMAFDLITSRAVSDAKTIYDLALPFMNSATILLLYKGKKSAIEADAIGAETIEAAHSNYLVAKRRA
ncbi:hypothetical protein AGMMS50229_13150 [Campylobacterota bacterium]|nr:hypothetical protein AGMMS50229_13150 [Campylobacterota bacterium]